MDTDIAVGDVVRLKSGGVEMTVDALVLANGDAAEGPQAEGCCVRTIWTDEAGTMHVSGALQFAVIEVVDKAGPREDERKDAAEYEPFQHNAFTKGLDAKERDFGTDRTIARQDAQQGPDPAVDPRGAASGLNRPKAAYLQSQDQEAVHVGDDHPQSLGNEAERQPAQEAEIAHAKTTDDPHDDVHTTHEVGKDYQADKALKDNR